jgi:hypothetical protein
MKHPLDFCRGEIATVSTRQHGCKRSSILAGFRSLTARNLSRGREGHASPADPIVNVAQIHLLKTALKVHTTRVHKRCIWMARSCHSPE